jgi:hypothetical protein
MPAAALERHDRALPIPKMRSWKQRYTRSSRSPRASAGAAAPTFGDGDGSGRSQPEATAFSAARHRGRLMRSPKGNAGCGR